MTEISPILNTKTNSFITISADNRIHLWDIGTRKERQSYVEKNHLSHTYTCSALHQSRNDSLGSFAVGTSDGLVIIWELSRGVVLKTIGVIGNSPIPTDILFSHDGNSIFVSSKEQTVVQYSISTGEVIKSFKAGKKGSVKLALNPKTNVIAVAGSGIRIIDTDTGAKKKLDVSLFGGANTMTFSSCGRFLILCGRDSREVLVFNIQDGSDLGPRNVIAVDGYPVSISCLSSYSKGYIDILCIYADRGGCVIRIVLSSANDDSSNNSNSNNNMDDGIITSGIEDIITLIKISIKSHITMGCFGNIRSIGTTTSTTTSSSSSSSSTTVTNGKSIHGFISLVLGQTTYPSFHQCEYESNEGILLKEISIKSIPENIVSTSTIHGDTSTSSSIATTVESTNSKITTSISTEKTILGPLDTGGMKRPKVDNGESSSSSNNNNNGLNGTIHTKKARSGSNGSDMEISVDVAAFVEQTLEQRLEALSKTMTVIEQKPSTIHSIVTTKATSSSSSSSSSSTAVTPTSDSLVTLVEQSLQSGDNSLLEQCLSIEDSNVIEETCRRIPTNRVITFLKRLVSKFEKSPSRGILLTKWLSSLLKYHTSFLISVPDLAKQLGGLSQMLESRLASYTRLSSLSGRLDLLMAQVSSSSSSSNQQLIAGSTYVPRQIYIEE